MNGVSNHGFNERKLLSCESRESRLPKFLIITLANSNTRTTHRSLGNYRLPLNPSEIKRVHSTIHFLDLILNEVALNKYIYRFVIFNAVSVLYQTSGGGE